MIPRQDNANFFLTPYSKEAFIHFALKAGVLKFGTFTLKSGRISPYFFNAGLFYEGEMLLKLGEFYAQTLLENNIVFKHLFGPAYKGLPLATATAIALAKRGFHSNVTFNRKEIKSHGEGGELIGSPLNTGENTVIIDDVITAGTAFYEAQALIKKNNGKLHAVIIALDRCEQGINKISTLKEIEKQGIKVLSIIGFHDLLQYLKDIKAIEQVKAMQAYYQQYGA